MASKSTTTPLVCQSPPSGVKSDVNLCMFSLFMKAEETEIGKDRGREREMVAIDVPQNQLSIFQASSYL